MASAPQNTASMHGSAVVRGMHEFLIVGYSERKPFARLTSDPACVLHDLMHGNAHVRYHSINSGAFQVSNCTWDLVCTFDDQGHLTSISLDLLGTDITKDVIVTASIQIDDPRGQWPPAVWRSDAAYRFSTNFISKSMSWKLSLPDAFCGHEKRYVTDDDRLTILCTLGILQEDAQTAAEARKCLVSLVPAPTIRRDFQQLLLRPSRIPPSSKVTFLVEDTKFRAHTLVLAMRSPVFAAELFGHMMESTTQRVRIEDMRASTFRAMLQFIYTDELPIKPNNDEESGSSRNNFKKEFMARGREAMVHKLLVAADRYDFERLRLMCENILCESIDVETVMMTLLLVRGRQRCCLLEDCCIKYITSNPDVYDAVRATKDYEELKETCSSFIIEVNERVATHNMARHTSSPSSSSIIRRPTEEKSTSRVKLSKVFRIGDPNGKSPSIVLGSKDIFTKVRETRGFQKFITVNSAKSRYIGRNGSLTICCHLEVHTKACTTSTSTTIAKPMIIVPPSNIVRHLEQLMVSKQWSDVTFLVQESEIHVHWLIIAMRSPLLYEMLVASTTKSVVRISDMKAVVLRAILHFVYTDELLPVDDTVVAREMLEAACRFRLERMKAMCENLLAHLLSKDNAMSTLELAFRHHCEGLKIYCNDSIKRAMK
nr:BTB/POZ and MATH domain-containing protein 2-like [Aegilops tauschii subsp. strangulata]